MIPPIRRRCGKCNGDISSDICSECGGNYKEVRVKLESPPKCERCGAFVMDRLYPCGRCGNPL